MVAGWLVLVRALMCAWINVREIDVREVDVRGLM